MTFLLGPLADAVTANIANPFSGDAGNYGLPMLTPSPLLGGQGVFCPFNTMPMFPTATPGVERGFYGSGLFGGVSTVSPFSLGGDDFYQRDLFTAGQALLGWGNAMADPFSAGVNSFLNPDGWSKLVSYFAGPAGSVQQTPAETETAQNQSGQAAAGEPGIAEGRKELEARAKEIEEQAKEKQLELKKAEDKVREDADKRDKKFDEKVENNEKETEADRLKAKNESEADFKRQKKAIEKAQGKASPAPPRGGDPTE